jgi:hypothetical protein
MFKRKCVVKFVNSLGIGRAAKVEAESLFEAAIRGRYPFYSSFWASLLLLKLLRSFPSSFPPALRFGVLSGLKTKELI